MQRLLTVLVIGLALMVSAVSARTAKVSRAAESAVAMRGSARLIVVLRPEASPLLRNENLALRSLAIESTRSRVLRTLPPRGYRLVRSFATVAAFALVADGHTLAQLRRHPDVSAVDLDAGGDGHALAPDAAAELNTVSGLAALGLDGLGLKVAVIDSGVDSDHPDLRARLIGEACFCSIGSGCCPNGTPTQFGSGAAEDDHGHGTNVAGIMVGEGNVAPRGALPRASLVAVKVIDSSNRFCCTSDIIAALDWIVREHPDVAAVNLSLGTDALFAGDCDTAAAHTQAMSQAVATLVSRGIVVVASAGNQGNPTAMSSPACVRDVFSLGATWDFSGGPRTFLGCSEESTAPRQPACFSNRSTTTDLYAAGAFVSAPGRGGATSTYGGTSQAAPMATACAVALRQAAPSATLAQRLEAMRLSPTRVVDLTSGRQYGFLDCLDAVRLLAPRWFDPNEAQCSGAPVPPADILGGAAPANASSSPQVESRWPREVRGVWKAREDASLRERGAGGFLRP